MLARSVVAHRRTSRCPRHSCRASETTAPGGRDGRCVARPRFQAPVDRAPRTRPDGPPSDGTRRGTQDNRSTIPLAVVPTPVSFFRLHKMTCRFGILNGSDRYNNRLRDATGVKREEDSKSMLILLLCHSQISPLCSNAPLSLPWQGALTRYIGDLGKSRQAARLKARDIHGNITRLYRPFLPTFSKSR